MFSGIKSVNQFCVTPFRHVKLVFTIFFRSFCQVWKHEIASRESLWYPITAHEPLLKTNWSLERKKPSRLPSRLIKKLNTIKNRRKFIKEVVLKEQDSGYVGIFDVLAPLDCVQNSLVYIDFSITIDLNRLTYKLLVNKNPLMKSRSKNHQPQDRKMSLFSKANSLVYKLVLIYQEIRSSWFVFICRGALN